MRFRQYLNEVISSNWEYKLPDDKEQQLYDFYMLSVLSDKTNSDKVNYFVNEAKEILFPSLKEELLDAVFYAICSEFKYFFNKTRLKVPLEQIVSKNYIKEINKINKNIKIIKSKKFNINKRIEDFARKIPTKDAEIVKSERGSSISDHKVSYVSVLRSNLSKPEFVKLAKTLFESENIVWSNQYGGKSWGLICNGWLKLYKAKDLNNIMVWIDHIYNLQHNTDTVFNKLVSYYTNENGHKWILESLNVKKNTKNPFLMINKVSPQMKQLALPALKASGHGTLEDSTTYALKEFDNLFKFYKERDFENLPQVIMNVIYLHPYYAFNYAKHFNFKNVPIDVIKGISKNPKFSYSYASEIDFKNVPKIIIQSIKNNSSLYSQYKEELRKRKRKWLGWFT